MTDWSEINQQQSNLLGQLTPEERARHQARHAEAAARQAVERRNRIAENFAYALVASEAHHINYIPSVAIDLADALIAELDK
jgi:hypothetical protein